MDSTPLPPSTTDSQKKGSEENADSGKPIKKGSGETADSGKPIKKGSEETADSGKPIKKGSEETADSGKPIKKGSGETADSGKPIKCEVCDVWCSGVIAYQSHLQGRPHYTKLVKPETANGSGTPATTQAKKRPSGTTIEILRCEVCDVSCQGKEQFDVHMVGVRHAKKAKLKDVEVDLSTMPFIEELDGKRFRCTICNVEVTGRTVVLSHVQGIKHQRRADSNTPKPPVTPSKKREKTTTTPTGEPLECKVCKLPVNSLFQLEEHKKSIKHMHKEEAYNKWAIQQANLGKDYDAWDPSG